MVIRYASVGGLLPAAAALPVEHGYQVVAVPRRFSRSKEWMSFMNPMVSAARSRILTISSCACTCARHLEAAAALARVDAVVDADRAAAELRVLLESERSRKAPGRQVHLLGVRHEEPPPGGGEPGPPCQGHAIREVGPDLGPGHGDRADHARCGPGGTQRGGDQLPCDLRDAVRAVRAARSRTGRRTGRPERTSSSGRPCRRPRRGGRCGPLPGAGPRTCTPRTRPGCAPGPSPTPSAGGAPGRTRDAR